MRAFAEDVSTKLTRSRAAWVRAHLEAKAQTLRRKIDEEIAHTEITVQWAAAWARNEGAAPVTDALCTEAGLHASETLVRALATSGLDEEEQWTLAEGWAGAGRRYARAWIAERAGEAALRSAVETMRALADATPGDIPDGTTLERITEIARHGAGLRAQLERCERWLAWETCLSVPREQLGATPARWRAWLLSQSTRREVSETDAMHALRSWRWPNVHPPMRLAGLGAGTQPAIEGDSAWANAIACEGASVGTPKRDRAAAWVARMRADEASYEARRRAEVGARALEWTRERTAGANAKADAERALARWRAMWRACPHLPGEGATERLVLAERTAGGCRRVVWTTPVAGPEGLIGASIVHRVRPGALALAATSATLELVLWPEIGSRLGRARWDRGSLGETTGEGTADDAETMATLVAHAARAIKAQGGAGGRAHEMAEIVAGQNPPHRPDALNRAVMTLAPVVAEIDAWALRAKTM